MRTAAAACASELFWLTAAARSSPKKSTEMRAVRVQVSGFGLLELNCRPLELPLGLAFGQGQASHGRAKPLRFGLHQLVCLVEYRQRPAVARHQLGGHFRGPRAADVSIREPAGMRRQAA